MKKWAERVAVATVVMGLVGCNVTNQDVGVVTGGALGGVLGSTIGHGTGKTVAIIGGSLLGAWIGSSIGKSMDKVDQMKFNQALETAPTNKPYNWQNPDNGNTFTVVPTATVVTNGQPCREFTTTANIGGKNEKIYGRACRDASGQWKVIS